MSFVPPAANGAAAVSTDSIVHRFGRRWVLRGVDLEVERGSAVALMGRNGSGKTTLLRIVSTLLSPTRGRARVFGMDTRQKADDVRRSVGLLAHDAGLYDDLTAEENLAFSYRMRGLRADGERVRDVLRSVGLERDVGSRVRGFSAGMRRRLALARILANPPALLLLDEPFASFDQDGIEIVNTLVRSTCDRGGAVLLATHDPVRAFEVVDRVVRIEDGLIVEKPLP